MSDVYFGGSSKKYISKHKIKEMKSKMKKSFEKADELIEKEKIIRARDEVEADNYLDESLGNLDL